MSVLLGAIEGSLTMAAPLLLAAIGETVVQRSGVVNVGIEGLLLSGALAAVISSQSLHNAAAGVVIAALASLICALLFALFAVKMAANQVVIGVVINLLALGLTGTVNRIMYGSQSQILSPPALTHYLGNQTVLSYFAMFMVFAVQWWLHHTRGGLQLRACGEQPLAADAAGINVVALRVKAVMFGGAMAGLAGACLTLGDVPTFQEGMSAGRGFIALAIVTAGRWNPMGCLAAAIVFGASEELELQGQAMGLRVPHDLLLAAPYVMTLVILMLGGRLSSAPKSLGVPFRRA